MLGEIMHESSIEIKLIYGVDNFDFYLMETT